MAELVSLTFAVWLLAVVCFVTLREYFSLLNIRLQDRWGIWGAYLAIPLMVYCIQINRYDLFTTLIPIYVFLVIPFLVALGGSETDGTVFSVGAIDFGLFLFVYCAGHIGYLMLLSTWAAVLLVMGVSVCDGVAFLLAATGKRIWSGKILKYVVTIPITAVLSIFLSQWTSIPIRDALALGILIPMLVIIGRYIMIYIEDDLGIAKDYEFLRRGRLINSSCSLLFAAPIIYHYARYFLT